MESKGQRKRSKKQEEVVSDAEQEDRSAEEEEQVEVEEEAQWTAAEEVKLSAFGYIEAKKRKRGMSYAPAADEWEENPDADSPFCRYLINMLIADHFRYLPHVTPSWLSTKLEGNGSVSLIFLFI
jgi:hypothetical protein